MSSFKKFISISLLACFLGSCGNLGPNEWVQFVPDETPFVVIPARDATLQTALNTQYVPLLDDISSSSIALLNEIDSTAANALQLKSILLYPGTDQKLQPIWIAQAPQNFMENMKAAYEQLYGQQYYFFEQIPILKMRTGQRTFYAAQINEMLLLSESSLGIENAIRVYQGEQPGALMASVSLKPGSLVMNTPALDTWLTQQSKVIYYKNIQNAFSGTKPAMLTITHKDSTVGGGLKLSGAIPLSDEPKSTLIKAVSSQNAPISLDKYISFDAAAFAFFRLPPAENFPESLIDTTAVDSFFIQNTAMFRQISNTLGGEFAVEFFAESGFRSVNEHAFIRKIKNPDRLRELLNELARQGLSEKIEDTYYVRSFSLCRLIGSELCQFSSFYIKIVDEVVVIAPRRGLVELVASDYRRRQSVIYESFYKKIKQNLPEEVSGLAIGGKKLMAYLQKYLKNDSYLAALTSKFDYISIAAVKEGGEINFALSTYHIKSEEKPFIENWVFPVGAELSGPPVFADLQGSANEEIIFATTAGKIYLLSSDGSLINTYTTGSETPIGSPVTYDWYNTGQQIVMIAAGNKIYAWGGSGNLLPGFPFELEERITTPLIVTDLNSNGLPDAIVATANRKLHALSARGNPLVGWPVEVNAVIRDKPLATRFRGRNAVVAFASNAVHIWSASGRSFSSFPRFIDATFVGSPVKISGEIVGAAANGTLYAFGEGDLFENSLSSSGRQFFSSGAVEMLSVSQDPLFGTPLVSQQENLAVMNAGGTVYLFDTNGNLLFAKSMGQAPSSGWIPVVTDINSDKRLDIAALAGYGRLYAWDIKTGERVHQLPATAMNNMTIGDIDGDGLAEIVGQTENGIHSWTIN